MVLVSHDREFLARSVTRVLELDLAQNTTTVFGGGYESYLEEREVGRRHKREQYDEFAEKKADLVARAHTAGMVEPGCAQCDAQGPPGQRQEPAAGCHRVQ